MKKSRLTRPRPSKSAAQIDRIGQLEARIADLEGRLARLESSPANWPKIGSQPLAPDPWGDEARCGTCGNRFKDMTHYVCNHPQCPSRITVTCGTTLIGGDPNAGCITAGTPFATMSTHASNAKAQ